MKVIFSTNLPSPYRVDFFNELGKSCDLTVLYERESSSERDSKWRGKSAQNYKEVYLNLRPYRTDLAKGRALKDYIQKEPSDILVFTNYSSPATQQAIIWCRLHQRKYYMEYDGGFNKTDPFFKRIYKQILLKGAVAHLTTADEHVKYLISLGISKLKIFKYPFTSLTQQDIVQSIDIKKLGKVFFREKLGIKEKYTLLTVGRFSNGTAYRKGYDILMNIAKNMDSNIGIYIVGEKPTAEYINLKEKYQLNNIHFIGFKTKSELAEYYAAADLFILLTREDIWGLVINEAMAFGLPIITSDKCIAGLELIRNNINGLLVSLNDENRILFSINSLLSNPTALQEYGNQSQKIIANYTIEAMSARHIDIWH